VNVHFSRASDEWETPPDLFATLDAEFHFTLDAAASARNRKCKNYFSEMEDGLKREWFSFPCDCLYKMQEREADNTGVLPPERSQAQRSGLVVPIMPP